MDIWGKDYTGLGTRVVPKPGVPSGAEINPWNLIRFAPAEGWLRVIDPPAILP